jgi:hypothetical protein
MPRLPELRQPGLQGHRRSRPGGTGEGPRPGGDGSRPRLRARLQGPHPAQRGLDRPLHAQRAIQDARGGARLLREGRGPRRGARAQEPGRQDPGLLPEHRGAAGPDRVPEVAHRRKASSRDPRPRSLGPARGAAPAGPRGARGPSRARGARGDAGPGARPPDDHGPGGRVDPGGGRRGAARRHDRGRAGDVPAERARRRRPDHRARPGAGRPGGRSWTGRAN